MKSKIMHALRSAPRLALPPLLLSACASYPPGGGPYYVDPGPYPIEPLYLDGGGHHHHHPHPKPPKPPKPPLPPGPPGPHPGPHPGPGPHPHHGPAPGATPAPATPSAPAPAHSQGGQSRSSESGTRK